MIQFSFEQIKQSTLGMEAINSQNIPVNLTMIILIKSYVADFQP
jgi:hypothetical protein